jgi:hypothetical protein
MRKSVRGPNRRAGMPNKAFECGHIPRTRQQGDNMRLSIPVLAALGVTAFLGVVTVAAPDAGAAARRTAVMSGARGEATATPTSRAGTMRGRRSTAIVGRTRHLAAVGRTRGARGAVSPRGTVFVRGRRSAMLVRHPSGARGAVIVNRPRGAVVVHRRRGAMIVSRPSGARGAVIMSRPRGKALLRRRRGPSM